MKELSLPARSKEPSLRKRSEHLILDTKENYQLIQGDCIDILPSFPSNSIDLCIIDPPYSSGTRQVANTKASQIPKRGKKWAKAGIVWDSSFTSFGLSVFMNVLYRQIKRIMKEGSHIYSFIDWRHYPLLSVTIEATGLFTNNLIVWNKGAFTLGGNYRSQYELIIFSSKGVPKRVNSTTTGNVLKYSRVANAVHPTEKPIALIRKLIMMSSEKGELVLDPMAGSGVVLQGCQELERRNISIEINSDYCQMIKNRCLFQSRLLEVGGGHGKSE